MLVLNIRQKGSKCPMLRLKIVRIDLKKNHQLGICTNSNKEKFKGQSQTPNLSQGRDRKLWALIQESLTAELVNVALG